MTIRLPNIAKGKATHRLSPVTAEKATEPLPSMKGIPDNMNASM